MTFLVVVVCFYKSNTTDLRLYCASVQHLSSSAFHFASIETEHLLSNLLIKQMCTQLKVELKEFLLIEIIVFLVIISAVFHMAYYIVKYVQYITQSSL